VLQKKKESKKCNWRLLPNDEKLAKKKKKVKMALICKIGGI
jgi:hypothetical protein